MNCLQNMSGSSMGVVALSHSISFSLKRKFIPNSSNRSLPMIMSYLDDNLSVSSTKADQLMSLFSWKAGSMNLILQILVVWKLPALVDQFEGFPNLGFRFLTKLW